MSTNTSGENEDTVGGMSADGHYIQEEGTTLRQRPYLNFTGSLLTCSDSGGKTVCNTTVGSISESMIPDTDNTYDIGENSTPLEWRSIYIDGVGYIDSFGQALIPLTDDVFDIGSVSVKWKDLHLDGSAYIDDFAQSIMPHNTDTYDIGSSSFRFDKIYAQEIIVDVVTAGSIGSSSDTLQAVTDRGATTDVPIVSSAVLTAEQLTSTDDASVSDTLTAGTLTDGVLSINVGAITGATDGTFTGTVTAEHFASTDDLEVADELKINGTMTISSGSIVDSTGNLSLGSSNVSVGGDLTVSGNINLTGISSGHIKPTTDQAYELGGESKRYTRVCALQHRFDPDTYISFDGNFIEIYVNGVLYKRYGSVVTVENVVFAGENVLFAGEQVVF